jgi:hypothetical protein
VSVTARTTLRGFGNCLRSVGLLLGDLLLELELLTCLIFMPGTAVLYAS